ncbi:MAG TPA: copper resistance protein CopA, partial [Marinobacter adhaerens]|nr:copper resistance protein CopA [Marinobacter adhaerens]
MGLLAGFDSLLPAYARGQLDNTNAFHTVRNGADIYDLTVARTPLKIGGTVSEQPITINGTLPAPLVRLKQGREAILRVTNTLPEATSIHWHGLILPYQMDGVPGVSFPGIMPGETFEYRFPVEQHGTYWYHSHSGLQEQLGHYG